MEVTTLGRRVYTATNVMNRTSHTRKATKALNSSAISIESRVGLVVVVVVVAVGIGVRVVVCLLVLTITIFKLLYFQVLLFKVVLSSLLLAVVAVAAVAITEAVAVGVRNRLSPSASLELLKVQNPSKQLS